MDKIESGCPPKTKTKNIHIDHEKNVKKIQKKPCTTPVPGLEVFSRVKIVVKNTLGPGTGVVPGFFRFSFTFYSWSICLFFVLEEKFAGQPTFLFKILSNKFLI